MSHFKELSFSALTSVAGNGKRVFFSNLRNMLVFVYGGISFWMETILQAAERCGEVCSLLIATDIANLLLSVRLIEFWTWVIIWWNYDVIKLVS